MDQAARVGEQGKELEVFIVAAKQAFLVKRPKGFRPGIGIFHQKWQFNDRGGRIAVTRDAVQANSHIHHACADLIGLTVDFAKGGCRVINFDFDLAVGFFRKFLAPAFEEVFLEAVAWRQIMADL